MVTFQKIHIFRKGKEMRRSLIFLLALKIEFIIIHIIYGCFIGNIFYKSYNGLITQNAVISQMLILTGIMIIYFSLYEYVKTLISIRLAQQFNDELGITFSEIEKKLEDREYTTEELQEMLKEYKKREEEKEEKKWLQ